VAFVVPLDKSLIRYSGGLEGSLDESLEEWTSRRDAYATQLRGGIRQHIGPIAKPRDIVFVEDVPKTRSGKIMRRLLTQLFEGTTLGDTTSLQNEPCIPGIDEICREGARA
jgi:acetyl-CoA synthetase